MCSCVICPSCGTWGRAAGAAGHSANAKKEDIRTKCPVSECGKEFSFEASETRLFELPVSLLERRHFYRSDLS